MSSLEPEAGEEVRIWVPYGGAWPPDLTWEGVDSHEGVEARSRAPEAGQHEVEVAGLKLTLHVQEASNAPPPTVASQIRPLAELGGLCLDRRFPRLAGPYAVGCSRGGAVDRAVDLRTGEVLPLEGLPPAPGVGPGRLYHPGAEGGLWVLPGSSPAPLGADRILRPAAPAAVDARRAAVLTADQVALFSPGDRSIKSVEASPLPWYPPALAGLWMAWSDRRDEATTGADIWLWDGVEGRRPVPLARGPGQQRHVAGSGRFLGWVDEEGVWVEDMESGERRLHPARTGFRAGISMWGPVACWEERPGGAITIRCSDGMEVTRGEPGWPGRWGPWLLYRDGDRPMLATALELVLEDDDPRATSSGVRAAGGHGGAHRDGPVQFHLRWPAPGWCVGEWRDGAWRPLGPAEVGALAVTSAGDAIRLTPAGTAGCLVEQ